MSKLLPILLQTTFYKESVCVLPGRFNPKGIGVGYLIKVIISAFKEKEYLGLTICYLTKAFDLVPHEGTT